MFDENLSWYLNENILTFATAPATVNKEEDGFIESNKMHGLKDVFSSQIFGLSAQNLPNLCFSDSFLAINGFVFRNLKGLTMCKGNKVTWHLSGLGSELDINSLYFQGNRFIYLQNRRDSISVFPHISHTVTMEPDSTGS